MIRFVARTYPPCWVLNARIQKHRGKPLLFHNKCPGFFYVHYTTHGTYSFTSHLKDKAIMVKCLAQGHKRRDRPGRVRTHILATSELESNALDRSATTLHIIIIIIIIIIKALLRTSATSLFGQKSNQLKKNHISPVVLFASSRGAVNKDKQRHKRAQTTPLA